jgi:hypothetical protein
MKATKIFIALAATAAICLAVIGVAYGYYITNQTTVNTNTYTTTDGGFWSWFGGCLGFGPNQPYSYPCQYQTPSNNTAQPPATYVPPQQPFQPQNPNQGYYPYRNGRSCWGW